MKRSELAAERHGHRRVPPVTVLDADPGDRLEATAVPAALAAERLVTVRRGGRTRRAPPRPGDDLLPVVLDGLGDRPIPDLGDCIPAEAAPPLLKLAGRESFLILSSLATI